jgi:hypothetical protein
MPVSYTRGHVPVSYTRTGKSHTESSLPLAAAGILVDTGHSSFSSYNPDQAGSIGNVTKDPDKFSVVFISRTDKKDKVVYLHAMKA